MRKQEYDIILMGGGIIGLSLAWEEILRGKKVLVLDNTQMMTKSSGTAAGILTHRGATQFASPFREFQVRSAELYPTWLEQLNTASDQSISFDSYGEYHFYDTQSVQGKEQLERELQKLEREQASGYVASPPIPSSLETHIKIPNSQYEAISFPNERSISPVKLGKLLRQAGEQQGGEYWEYVQANSLHYSSTDKMWRIDGKKSTELADTETSFVVEGEYLGITAGVYSNDILNTLGWELPLIPVKGQVFQIPRFYSEEFLIHFDSNLYIVPRDENCVVGATSKNREFSEEWESLGEEQLDTSLNKWLHIAPQLLDNKSLKKVGLRPRTQDRYPFMGWVEQSQKLFICTGHHKCGIGMAPLSAKYMSHIIHDDKILLDSEEYQRYWAFDPLRKKGLRRT